MDFSPSDDGVGNNPGLEECTVMLEEPLRGDLGKSVAFAADLQNGEEARVAAGLCLTCSSFSAPKLAAVSFMLPDPAKGSPVLCRFWLLRTQLLHEREKADQKASIKPSHLQPL